MNKFYGLLKLPFFYAVFIWMMNHASFAIPVKRLRETDSLLAFFHPKPATPFHVILIPKKAVRAFTDLEPGSPFLADLVTTAQDLVAMYALTSYCLIVNGGDAQEFPHLHFHLISGSLSVQPSAPER